MRKPKSIEARSIVSGRDVEPYILIVLLYDDGTEETITQWTPDEARHHVTNVLSAIEAANTDAFLVTFLTGPLGMQFQDTAVGETLAQFRAWRKRRLPPERTQ